MSGRYQLREDPDDEFRNALVDTKTGEEIAYDRGEPEDNTFTRDWSWVPVLLNELEARAEKAESERDAAVARIDKLMGDE